MILHLLHTTQRSFVITSLTSPPPLLTPFPKTSCLQHSRTEHTVSGLASGQLSFSMIETPESMEVDVISQPQTVGSRTENVHVGVNCTR